MYHLKFQRVARTHPLGSMGSTIMLSYNAKTWKLLSLQLCTLFYSLQHVLKHIIWCITWFYYIIWCLFSGDTQNGGHFVRHLGFLKTLKGENTSPPLEQLYTSWATIISKEKNFIENFMVTPYFCWTTRHWSIWTG